MSLPRSRRIAKTAIDCGLEIAWAQWSALGSLASSRDARRSRSLVDPEALILISFHVLSLERRLEDLLAWWASVGSALVSVKRLKSLSERFPGKIQGFFSFASMAFERGDRRWRTHANLDRDRIYREGKGPSDLSLAAPSALWLRLRSALGVGAKADVLAFLLGIHGARASAREMSDATGYTTTAVRAAADELAKGRLIRSTSRRPVEYFAPPRPWADLLELEVPTGLRDAAVQSPLRDLPVWHSWAAIFVFLAEVDDWAQRVEAQDLGERVVASRARDLVERHMSTMHRESIRVPEPRGFHGTDALWVLEEMVAITAEWARENT